MPPPTVANLPVADLRTLIQDAHASSNSARDWYKYAANKSEASLLVNSGVLISNMIMYFTIIDAPDPQSELGVASYKLPRLKQCLEANIVLSFSVLLLNATLRLWPGPQGALAAVAMRMKRDQAHDRDSGDVAHIAASEQDEAKVGKVMNLVNKLTILVSLGQGIAQALVAAYTTAPSEAVPIRAVPENGTLITS